MNFMKYVTTSWTFIKKIAPELLTGFAVAGVVGTAIAASKDSVKATEHIKEAEELKGGKLTAGEKIKVAGKDYIRTGITVLATSACAIGAAVIYRKRIAGLAALLAVTQQALIEEKDKVSELIKELPNGEEKQKELEDKQLDKKIKEANNLDGEEHLPKLLPVKESVADRLCVDNITGQFFYSTYDKIKDYERQLQSQIDKYSDTVTFEDWLSLTNQNMVPWARDCKFDENNEFKLKIGNKLIDGVDVLTVKVLNAL